MTDGSSESARASEPTSRCSKAPPTPGRAPNVRGAKIVDVSTRFDTFGTRLGLWAAGLLLVASLATAADHVYPSAEAAQPLQPGAAVPSVSVRALDGSTVDLAKLARSSGALLVFYRGGW